MAATLVIHNIGLLATAAQSGLLRGDALGELHLVEGAAIAIDGERIVAVGSEREVLAAAVGAAERIDAHGALVIPGLVDCHAHPVFAGDRAAEFELRNGGASYEELHAAGGGIHSTVDATRAAIDDGSISSRVREHYDWMLAAGTTTTEAKSGYGLTVAHETRSVEVALAAADDHAIDAVATCLAAHTVPSEYDGNTDAYLDRVAIPALAAAREAGATAADIFLERGSFNADQASRYLQAAIELGLYLRLHSDQFSDQGGIALAAGLGARSVDHLEALDPAGVTELAGSDVCGVLLPLSSVFLRRPYAPGRALIDAGGAVALASDFNPGSSYGESLTLAMTLAATGCGLSSAEALNACTANAAWVLGLDDEVGRLAPGYLADIVLVDQPSVVHLAYHAGSPRIMAVIKRGRLLAAQDALR